MCSYFEFKCGRVAKIMILINKGKLFIDEIETGYVNDYKRLISILNKLADYGEIRNDKIFKYLENDIYEIKTTNLRITCFIEYTDKGKEFILVEYFKKPTSNKGYRSYIDRAIKRKKSYTQL
jgi:phage-related protein